MIGKILEFRETEKEITRKIAKYLANLNEIHNGRIPESKSQLVSDFYKYLLSHLITNLDDIPKKYQEIFAD